MVAVPLTSTTTLLRPHMSMLTIECLHPYYHFRSCASYRVQPMFLDLGVIPRLNPTNVECKSVATICPSSICVVLHENIHWKWCISLILQVSYVKWCMYDVFFIDYHMKGNLDIQKSITFHQFYDRDLINHLLPWAYQSQLWSWG